MSQRKVKKKSKKKKTASLKSGTKKATKKKTKKKTSKPKIVESKKPLAQTAPKSVKKPERLDQMFRGTDVRILRECLAGVYKMAPPHVAKKINSALLEFAKSIKEYCECHDRAWVDKEKKFACLNCGKRSDKDSKLKVVE